MCETEARESGERERAVLEARAGQPARRGVVAMGVQRWLRAEGNGGCAAPPRRMGLFQICKHTVCDGAHIKY